MPQYSINKFSEVSVTLVSVDDNDNVNDNVHHTPANDNDNDHHTPAKMSDNEVRFKIQAL
jgi:hypothetical protein